MYQILQPLLHSQDHLDPLLGVLRTRIEGCSEALADLLHPDLEMVTLIGKTGRLSKCPPMFIEI